MTPSVQIPGAGFLVHGRPLSCPQCGPEPLRWGGCTGLALKSCVHVIRVRQGINIKLFVHTHIKKQFGLLLRLLQYKVM